MAPEVRFSSAAAAVKLDVRAAASNALSQVRVGRPTRGRFCGTGPPSKKLGPKVPKYSVVCRLTFNLLWPNGHQLLGFNENKCTGGRDRRRHDGCEPALSSRAGRVRGYGIDRKGRAHLGLDLARRRPMPEHHRQLQPG